MNILVKIVGTILILLVCQINSAAADQWVYIDPLRPSKFLSIETNPDAIGMYDLQHDAKYCKLGDEFICIKSNDFQFYVPRDLLRLGRAWNVGGIKYRVTSKNDLMLLGIKDVIYYIDQSDRGRMLRFLYSTSRGLVGIGGVSENGSAIFLLDVRCGYGAPSKCSK